MKPNAINREVINPEDKNPYFNHKEDKPSIQSKIKTLENGAHDPFNPFTEKKEVKTQLTYEEWRKADKEEALKKNSIK